MRLISLNQIIILSVLLFLLLGDVKNLKKNIGKLWKKIQNSIKK